MATKEKSIFQPAETQNPDEFATGRPDKFVGIIRSVLAYPYVGKQSKDGKHYLYVGVMIDPDEDSGYTTFTESYFAGYLNRAVPSKDNETPAGGKDEDYILLSKGESDGLDKPCLDSEGNVIKNHDNVGRYILGKPSQGFNWHFFLTNMREADEKGLIDWNLPGYDLERFNGLKCRFDRLEQKDRGPVKEGQKAYPVLVPTSVLGFEKAAGKSTSRKTQEKEESNNNSLGDRIIPEILKALGSAKENKLLKGELMAKVAKSFDKSERGNAYGWFDNDDNLKNIDGVDVVVDTDKEGNEFIHALELA